MTAETYLLYVAPVALLGFVFAMQGLSDAYDRRRARLQPVRVRRDDARR